MPNCDDGNSLNLLSQAECEMAAFLNAAAEVLGTGGRRVGAEAWFDALESLSWPKDNFQKFFRVVSIRAISQIVAGTGTKKGMATPSAIDGIGRLPELQKLRSRRST